MRRAHPVHNHFGNRKLAALGFPARFVIDGLRQAIVFALIDAGRSGTLGLLSKGARAPQHRLHHHRARIGALKQAGRTAGA